VALNLKMTTSIREENVKHAGALFVAMVTRSLKTRSRQIRVVASVLRHLDAFGLLKPAQDALLRSPADIHELPNVEQYVLPPKP
jgi:hypothetical protein